MADNTRNVRYEPNENPPPALAIGLAWQYALLFVSGIVITPAIIVRAAGGEDSYMLWAAFAALLISGITTMLQAIGYKRIGAGYILFMGTSGTFIAISIKALAKGGPSLLATLVIVSALFQFFLAWKLAAFRRIFNSTVGGTIIMLVAVTVMPIVFSLLGDVPATAPAHAAPVSAIITVLCIVIIVFKSSGILRLWAPVIGIVVGTLTAAALGAFDSARIINAGWIGLPLAHWPGLSFDFSPAFWVLLPSFVFVTIIGAIETVGDTIAVQQISWRKSRSIDFRSLQGAVSADGTGNLLSGLFSTIPNSTYSGGISLVELTGVASRRVGLWVGGVLILLAFSPKVTAVILSIPNPVAAAYIGVLLALLFIVGVKLVVHNGDYRRCMIAGIGFWMGYGFQSGKIFPELISGDTWGLLLQDGMTAGGLVALGLSMLMELVDSRRHRLKANLNASSMPKIHAFLSELAAAKKWNKEATMRLCSAGEETVLTLVEQQKTSASTTAEDKEVDDDDDEDVDKQRHLLITARGNHKSIEIECIAAPGEENLEDRMVLLKEGSTTAEESDLALRILRHVSSSFQHQQYHDTDIITVRVDAEQPAMVSS